MSRSSKAQEEHSASRSQWRARPRLLRSCSRLRHLSTPLADACAVVLLYYLVLNFRYARTLAEWQPWTLRFGLFVTAAVVVHLTLNWLTGAYKIVARYMSLPQALRMTQAGVAAVALLFLLAIAWPAVAGTPGYMVPRSVVIVGGIGSLIAMVGARFFSRVVHERHARLPDTGERLLLVGAGQAADMLLREINRTPALGVKVVGLVDNKPELQSMTIQGYPVLGRVADIPELVAKHRATQILVSIPSASADEIATIYRTVKPTGLPIKVLPSLAELVSGAATIHDIRDLDVRDLLDRPTIQTDLAAITHYIKNHSVLVTGAGGSIGSELCRQIARFGPSELIAIDHDETALYELHESLQNQHFQDYVLYPTNILYEKKLRKIFGRHRPKLVFHAAAYKHVPLMELHPDEAVLNNVKGTLTVAQVAAEFRAERFVNISTDKAVEPTSVMGATKRAGELIIQAVAAKAPRTRFASVRFGNVLGSQGSVIPIFRSQIESGGPLVITHPDMTRYFMLIEEAVQLVLQAAVIVDQGDCKQKLLTCTFILDMGEPVSIVELAQRMIEFYWTNKDKSLGVEFSGLRPGEKLEERLVYSFEEAVPSVHPLIKQVRLRDSSCCAVVPDDFEYRVERLIQQAEKHLDRAAILGALADCVPEYHPPELLSLEKPAKVV